MLQEININWIDISNHKPKFIIIKKSNIHGDGAFADKNIKKKYIPWTLYGKNINRIYNRPLCISF